MSTLGIIFDWDGVVLDSSAHHERSWEMLAQEEGLTLPTGHFKKGFGMRNERVIPEVLGWHVSPDEIQRLSLRKEALYREIVRSDGISPLPGVVSLLNQLYEAGIPTAVGSSTHLENIESVLDVLELNAFFSAIVSSKDVTKGKPDPEVFLKAADKIGVAARQCIVIEDAPVGVEAGKRAGMTVVALLTSNPSDQLSQADKIIQDLSEIDLDGLRQLIGG